MVNNSAIEPAKFNVKVYMNMIQLVRLCGGTYNEKCYKTMQDNYKDKMIPVNNLRNVRIYFRRLYLILIIFNNKYYRTAIKLLWELINVKKYLFEN